jgi:hypothetical protein
MSLLSCQQEVEYPLYQADEDYVRLCSSEDYIVAKESVLVVTGVAAASCHP